jgi:hypothetical protein
LDDHEGGVGTDRVSLDQGRRGRLLGYELLHPPDDAPLLEEAPTLGVEVLDLGQLLTLC